MWFSVHWLNVFSMCLHPTYLDEAIDANLKITPKPFKAIQIVWHCRKWKQINEKMNFKKKIKMMAKIHPKQNACTKEGTLRLLCRCSASHLKIKKKHQSEKTLINNRVARRRETQANGFVKKKSHRNESKRKCDADNKARPDQTNASRWIGGSVPAPDTLLHTYTLSVLERHKYFRSFMVKKIANSVFVWVSALPLDSSPLYCGLRESVVCVSVETIVRVCIVMAL